MDKKQVLKIMSLVKKDAQKIKVFLDNYFVYDNCNCDACSRKRNGVKFTKLFKSMVIIGVLDIKKESMSEPGIDLFSALSRIYNNLCKTLDENKKNSTKISSFLLRDRAFCKICGKFINKKAHKTHVCDACLDNYFRKCYKCGEYELKTKKNNMSNGYFYCDVCVKTLVKCHECRSLHVPDKKLTKSNFIDSNGILITENVPVCSSCTAAYIECDGCGIFTHLSSIHSHDNKRFCSRCISDYIHLFDYNYKPTDLKFCNDCSKGEDTLFFGAEIEVECGPTNGLSRDKIIKNISDEFGDHLIFGKNDGSLHTGFEFVTHPFSWDWFTKNKNRFNILFIMSKLHGLYTAENCGIHIHMSKTAFTSYHLYKFISFINDEKNRSFINKICGRNITGHTYCSAENDKYVIARIAKDKEKYGARRNAAVNLMAHNTAEVRIFTSTLEANVFHSYIEFLHSLFKFTYKKAMKDCKEKAFRKYLHYNRNQNVNLLKRIGG